MIAVTATNVATDPRAALVRDDEPHLVRADEMHAELRRTDEPTFAVAADDAAAIR